MNLKNIQVYDAVLTITNANNAGSFQNFPSKELVIPCGITIRPDMFTGCKFNKVTIIAGTTSTIIDTQYLFPLKNSLDTGCYVIIHDSITEIKDGAFSGCAIRTLQVNNTIIRGLSGLLFYS